ncbi:hypothetical protein [Sphingomonas parapaucimobilis]|uniref:Lipoprotein n=1 Tax=Sphingomonas parapaucimobilis NBRC 15100 TaxID=1219049 RepID=A0A0A1WCQ2_9SPHN|nr:hypothetical protein [Sphingomonas parapaucimobilis]GAM02724.1 hypothetical protein SP5_097_00660 [Sphingomonas parapaucimobilis NBRC 15100]
MMTKITATAALALLTACGSASVTEQEAAAQTRTVAAPLTIAGIRIGMTALDVQATLVRTGWKIETSAGEDWVATVDHEAKRQRGVFPIEEPKNGIAVLNATKGDERLTVEFQPVPNGDAVKLVRYIAPAAGRTPEQIAAEMVKRYGRPGASQVAASIYEASWCTGGDPCRQIWGNMHQGLAAKLDVYGKLNISLSQGVAAERAWQNAVSRAVGRGTGPKSSF